jgi:hypothetical protein
MSDPIRVIKSVTMTDPLLTATSITEADHAAWSGATTYALGDRVILTSTHKIYESIQAANTNNDPATAANWWVEVSATNRWKLFDLSSTTQAVVDTADYYEITPGVAINAVGFINMSGILSIRVRLTDPSFGLVYDTTVDMQSIPSESSWYAWFFEARSEQTQYVFDDLPSYPNAVLRFDVASSGTAYIGGVTFGTQRSIGMGLRTGVRLGIQDFSRKERNDYGDTVLVQRAFAKRISLNTMILNTELDNTFTLLTELRALPCLWITGTGYSVLSLFGFYNNFEITIPYADYSECSIEIESLT